MRYACCLLSLLVLIGTGARLVGQDAPIRGRAPGPGNTFYLTAGATAPWLLAPRQAESSSGGLGEVAPVPRWGMTWNIRLGFSSALVLGFDWLGDRATVLAFEAPNERPFLRTADNVVRTIDDASLRVSERYWRLGLGYAHAFDRLQVDARLHINARSRGRDAELRFTQTTSAFIDRQTNIIVPLPQPVTVQETLTTDAIPGGYFSASLGVGYDVHPRWRLHLEVEHSLHSAREVFTRSYRRGRVGVTVGYRLAPGGRR